MLVAGVDDVRVDLVGDDHQVMPNHEIRYLLQFSPAEGAAGGVLRMAKYQHAQARVGRCFIGFQVEHPARAIVAHGVGDQAAARVLDGAHEGRIRG